MQAKIAIRLTPFSFRAVSGIINMMPGRRSAPGFRTGDGTDKRCRGRDINEGIQIKHTYREDIH